MPAMAGIVLLISWNLIDLDEIRGVFSVSYGETGILVVTFASTLLIALEFAIYFGVLLSLVLYLKLTARPPIVPLLLPWEDVELVGSSESVMQEDSRFSGSVEATDRDQSIKLLRVDGSLFFGAVDHIQLTLQQYTSKGYRHIILVGQGVNFIDFAGAELLAREVERLRALGGDVYFCSFKARALFLLRKDRYRLLLTEDNFFDSPEQALKKISHHTGVHHEYKDNADDLEP
jgi:SulP family sulfate permease